MINSLLNPVIYTVRKEEFLVAFTELLLRKSLQEAEEYQRRLFRTTNNAGIQQDEQQGEGQEQNAEERNAAHANDNQDDNTKVLATGANHSSMTTPPSLHITSLSPTAYPTRERKNMGREEMQLAIKTTFSIILKTSLLTTISMATPPSLHTTSLFP